MNPKAVESARAEIHARLRNRRREIEQEALVRTTAMFGLTGGVRPESMDGLRTAIRSAVGYSIDIVEVGEERSPPPPTTLLTHARLAARNQIDLDAVLRCYVAGYSIISDFVVEGVDDSDGSGLLALKSVLRTQATLLDRLLVEVTDEYRREAQRTPGTSEQRRSERVERLLAGELLDTSGLGYDFEGFHLAAIASGQDSDVALKTLAAEGECRLLVIRRSSEMVWGWLGRRHPIDMDQLMAKISSFPENTTVALGEVGEGLTGWRLSHRQARAAMPIGLRRPGTLVCYADVPILASVMHDDLLVTSLNSLYLAPLNDEPDGGRISRKTLRAYFMTERNVASAAVMLGVSRRTVAYRLRRIEDRLGRSLNSALAEVEIALSLDDLDASSEGPR